MRNMTPDNTRKTADAIKEYEMKFANELKDYVKKLRNDYKRDPDNACFEARQALLRTGVIRN